MKKLFSPSFRSGFAPLLIIGLVAIVVFVAFAVFGPLKLSNLGQLSLRQADQESHATSPPAPDIDGDGFYDSVENYIGTDPLDPCGDPVDATKPSKPSNAWPADLYTKGDSFGKIDIVDVTSFTAPVRKLDKKEGEKGFDKRWDLNGDLVITVADITILTTFKPSMLGGQRAYGGPKCPDQFLKATPTSEKVEFIWTPAVDRWRALFASDLTQKGNCDSVDNSSILAGSQPNQTSYTWNSSNPFLIFTPGSKYCAVLREGYSSNYGLVVSNKIEFTIPTLVSQSPTPSPNFPSAPTNISASGIQCLTNGNIQIGVYWTDTSNNEDGFKISVRKDSENIFTQIGAVPSNHQSFLWDEGQNGVKYIFMVTAYNTSGTNAGIFNDYIAFTPCPVPTPSPTQ